VKLPADPRARAAVVIIGALIGLAVLLRVIDALLPEPHGPTSSSYATSPHGLAAYASLLARHGHPVRQVRVPVADRRPRPGETLVVLDPGVVASGEARAIGEWVRAGGRLVAGGEDSSWLDEVLARPPELRGDAPADRRVLAPVPETAGVSEVRSDGGGWSRPGAALPAIGPARRPLLVTAHAGRGSVALLADPGVLQNRRLGQADAAALGLALAGGRGRPVAFLETVHGYGVARGFAGLPSRVKWLLAGLALAALAAVWAVGRRLGPPEDPERPLPPPRAEYVDALAAALVRADGRKQAKREEVRS
jgi:Domain of unknown function (DUF4350)